MARLRVHKRERVSDLKVEIPHLSISDWPAPPTDWMGQVRVADLPDTPPEPEPTVEPAAAPGRAPAAKRARRSR